MKKSILIIDDDTVDLEVMEEAFSKTELERVSFFSDAFQAIKHLKTLDEQTLPKVIVTDYNLPVVDGFNVLSFIKRHPLFSSIKVVIMTTAVSDAERSRLNDAGVNNIYIKPNTADKYRQIAEELIHLAEGK